MGESGFGPTFRQKEVRVVVDWVLAGVSGAVVGPAGAGKSNFLAFLGHRPEWIAAYFPAGYKPAAFIPIDLNILPNEKPTTFYRVILRAIYESQPQLSPTLYELAGRLYHENQAMRDPFLSQTALQTLLKGFQKEQQTLVFVLDHFDRFCQQPRPAITNSLRGIRDGFKQTLTFLVGMRQAVDYWPEPTALGELHELLDTHTCWLGPMTRPDTYQAIGRHTGRITLPPAAQEAIADLSGGYPALVTAICHWWLGQNDPAGATPQTLLADRAIQNRLAAIWQNLTQEEQLAISRLQRGLPAGPILNQLTERGLSLGPQQLFSPLFAHYVAGLQSGGRGKVWLQDGLIYQGETALSGLTQVELAVLTFLVAHPRQKHSKTDLIFQAWPKELKERGVTDDSLYQIIHQLRQVIEPDPAHPCYLVNWRGRPEGGYQFFPEGKPG